MADADYLLILLKHCYRSGVFAAMAGGVGINHLSASKFSRLALPLAPLEEQDEIVVMVRQSLAQASEAQQKARIAIERANEMRQAILRDAFSGKLVPQDPRDKAASTLLQRSLALKARLNAERVQARQTLHVKARREMDTSMQKQHPVLVDVLRAATDPQTGTTPSDRELFERAGYTPEEVAQFYEDLLAAGEVRDAYRKERDFGLGLVSQSAFSAPSPILVDSPGRFRLHFIWLGDFKNLKDYEVHFDQEYSTNVVLGWNGTGKSNLFEALVIIFRDLLLWRDYNRPLETAFTYRLEYEVDEHTVVVDYSPG